MEAQQVAQSLNEENINTMPQDRGLGDTIERITKATGVKKVAETISKKMGKDCGCGQRRDSLNRMFPYNK